MSLSVTQSKLLKQKRPVNVWGSSNQGAIERSEMDSFSHDVLKIEMSGPQYEHFSVVDLPGLFRNTSLATVC